MILIELIGELARQLHKYFIKLFLYKHNIIADISYSWLGSDFNDNKNKIITISKNWIADKEISDKSFESRDASKWI